jgi:ComF family protein
MTIARVRRTDEHYREMRDRLLAQGCVADLAAPFYFEKEGTLQTLIHQLKYDEITIAGVELGRHVAVAIAALFGKIPQARIVPVPLYTAKERERGYNQSFYIAQGLRSVTGLPVSARLLRRIRNTPSQTRLNREERQANVQDAFELGRGADVQGASFILVDDVMTTGATIQECARVLKKHGALRVYAASVALAAYAVNVDL